MLGTYKAQRSTVGIPLAIGRMRWVRRPKHSDVFWCWCGAAWLKVEWSGEGG